MGCPRRYLYLRTWRATEILKLVQQPLDGIVLVPDMLMVDREKHGVDTHGFQVTAEKLLKRDDEELAKHMCSEDREAL